MTKSRVAVPVAGAILLVTLAVWNSLHKSLWTDEAFSLIAASGSLSHAIQRARDYELQPPLYFILLNLWMRMSPALWFVRALSTLCVVISLIGLGAIAQQLRLARGLSPVLLAALTPGVVWAAAEARPYALTLALATWTLYFFLRLIADHPPHPWRDVACYAALAYSLLMTGYYGGFLLAGQWCGAVAVRRWRLPTIALGLVAVGLLPWVPTILAQAGTHPKAVSSFVGARHTLDDLVLVFLQAYLANIPELAWPHVAVAIVIVAAIVVVARWRVDAIAPDERAVIVALAVPIAILSIIRVTGVAAMQPRYLVMTIPTFLTVAALWTDRPASPAVRHLAAGATALTLIGGLLAFEWNGAEITDWRGVAALLAHDRTDVSEPVLVVPAFDELPLRYYYPGPGIVSGLAGEFDLTRYRPEAFTVRDTAQVLARLDSTEARSGAWIIVSQWDNSPVELLRLVEGALASRYCPVTLTRLYGVRVYHAVAPPCRPSKIK